MTSRDYERYAYLTIALDKDGPTYQALLKDAQEIGTKQLPTVAAMALKHYYAGAQHHIPSNDNDDGQGSNVIPVNKPASPILVKDSSTAEVNADAAIDEWA